MTGNHTFSVYVRSFSHEEELMSLTVPNIPSLISERSFLFDNYFASFLPYY